MPHDYRSIYRSGMEVLKRTKWRCDSERMFRGPSIAKGQAARLECERLSVERGMTIRAVCAEVMTAARIHHFITICRKEAQEYLLRAHCPLDPNKLAKLSRRMPPFIRAKMQTLLAGSVNVVSNPDHAFDTDGWTELTRRLPKFRATMEHFAASRIGTPIEAILVEPEIQRLSAKLQSIRHECDLIEEKLLAVQPGKADPSYRPLQTTKAKTTPDWVKAYARISQVHGVLQKTYRDLASEFWKPEWIPTETQRRGVTADVRAIAHVAIEILSWLRQE